MNYGFIGGGNMARAILQGLIHKGYAPERLWITDKNADKRAALTRDFGVSTTDSTATLLEHSDTLVLAVKPQGLEAALAPLAGLWRDDQVLVSVLAGTRLPALAQLCGELPIVRAMPNTPAAVGMGMTALVANDRLSEQQKPAITAIFSAIGEAVWLDDESDIDAVTALSGSGPAYYFLFVETMITAATQLGLDAHLATLLAKQTALGACHMLATSEDSPQELRTQVTSKGGTTQAALTVFQERGLEAITLEALQAASARSKALSQS